MTTPVVGGLSNEPRLAEVLEKAIRQRVFPGAYASVFCRGGLFESCAGFQTYDPGSAGIVADSIFDLASLTKVVATATATMHLIERGALALQNRASRYIPELATGAKSSITIQHLLSHSAGFPAFTPLFLNCKSREELITGAVNFPLAYAPGTRRVYDDVSFILLGLIIERVVSKSLDVFCRAMIFEPLGMHETMFNPPRELVERIVPTELPPGGAVIRGFVHDENSRMMGGVAGHAGLFSTGRDLQRFVRFMLGDPTNSRHDVLSTSTIRQMLVPQWRDRDGEYRLGWDGFRKSYMNGLNDPRAFGHTGFTGTSIVVSPGRGLAVLLLSNRVHPARTGPPMDPVRRSVAEAAMHLAASRDKEQSH